MQTNSNSYPSLKVIICMVDNRQMVLLIYTLLGIIITKVVCDTNKCRVKLLNDNKSVPDTAFTATSYFISQSSMEKKADFSAKAARENYDKENEEFAWCPSSQVNITLSEYLQIDLGRLTMIQVVQTKGRFAQGAGTEFTPFYRIRYSRNNGSFWFDYKKFKEKGFEKILNGPTDAFLDAFETLDPPIVAQIIRIFPYSPKSRRVCLKLQLFGCKFENDILEYQVPQGSPAVIEKNTIKPQSDNMGIFQTFHDNGYDGRDVNGLLIGGLGLLTDHNIGIDFTVKEKQGKCFLGWHQNRYLDSNKYINIIFTFLNRRNFSSIKLFSFSKLSLEIEYFERMDISFSDDNHIYSKAIKHDKLLNVFNQTDHSVTINITGTMGKYVNITLYFPSSWLLLSEISFISDPILLPMIDQPDNQDNNNKASVIYRNSKFDYGTTKPIDKPVNIEILYLLTILLCLLLGIITAICSFWIIIKKRRSHQRRSIKKQAMALCSQTSFIPYNHNSNSVQCLPNSLNSRPMYPSFTVDRHNYPNETLRNKPHIPVGYIPQSSSVDHNCFMTKQSNTDTNIYTSIIGSDNDSSLSPEYATTSITNESTMLQPNYDNATPYLPPPIEPIRPQIFNDSFMDTSDCPSFYYPHPNTIPNMQDHTNINLWRFNGQSIPNKGVNISSQISCNDFSKDIRKNDPQISKDNFTKISSIYSDLPRIHSHY